MDLPGRRRVRGAVTGKSQSRSRPQGAEEARERRNVKKGDGGKGDAAPPFGRKRRRIQDEDIDSDSVSGQESAPPTDSESDEEREVTDETRLRVAKQYLKQFSDAAQGRLQEQKGSSTLGSHELSADPAFDSNGEDGGWNEGSDEEKSDDDIFLDAATKAAVVQQLKQKAGEKKLLSRPTTSAAESLRFKDSTFLKGHKLPVTCVALPSGGCHGDNGSRRCNMHAYTGGKDCCIIRWDLETGSKEIFKGQRNCFGGSVGSGAQGSTSKLGGHFRAVLDVCVTEDERIFYSAGADHTVRAWDPRASNKRCMFELRGHRGPVTGVRFNGSSMGESDRDTELVTCSADKSLKTWSTSCRSVANHFYGHASEVNCLDLLQADKPITGGSDGTLRSWKLAQDTHAVFPPLGSCVDSVAVISPSLFAAGTQAGVLALFNSNCKKPLACVRVNQRSVAAEDAAERASAPLRATGAATSVSALSALPMTDALLVGTEGGDIQVWLASQNDRKQGGGILRRIQGTSVQVGGAVTDLCVSNDHSFAVAAVSTESRLGRWYKSDGAKNGIRILPLIKN